MKNIRCTRIRNRIINISDVADGNAVACAIVTDTNSYDAPKECFYDRMLSKSKRVQHNFTLLCLEWFKMLAETKDHNEQNAGSYEYAVQMPYEVRYDLHEKKRLSKLFVKRDFAFDFEDDIQAADLLECYLRRSYSDFGFLGAMLSVHKPCQQMFSRMCCEWLKCVAALHSNRPYVRFARKAVAHYVDFNLYTWRQV